MFYKQVRLIGEFSEEPERPFGEPPKMPHTLLWLFCLAGRVQTVKKPEYNALARFAAQTDPKSLIMNDVYRVHEELGMALTPGKILASSQRNIFQSVFIKLEKPKPPEKPCSFNCYPDNAKMELYLEKASTCWIGKQVFPSLTIVEIAHTDNKKECVIACLADRNCAVASYDAQKKLCTRRNSQFYSAGAISLTDTSSSLSIECFLYTVNETRSSLCRIENPIYDVLWKSAQQQMDQIFQLYQNRFEDLKTAYQFNITDVKGRRERAWSDFDFIGDIPLVGWFYKIIRSPRDNAMLKEHLHQLQGTFEQFTQVTTRNLNNLRTFSQKVLKIIQTQNTHVSRAIKELKCDVASVGAMVAHQNILQVFQHKLQELFFAIKHGKLMTDTTQILRIEDLKTIASENKDFQQTIFAKHPEIFYRVGNLFLAKVMNNKHFLVFHFIVVAPEFKLENMHQTFEVTQVPISSKNMSTCLMPQTPEILFIKYRIYYQADTEECQEQNDIIICNTNMEDVFSPSIKPFDCLNDNLDNCIMNPVPCHNIIKFTKSGALIHSRTQILGMLVGEETSLIPLGTEGKYNYFFT